jgi:Ohr subfamily peroxiredoxin
LAGASPVSAPDSATTTANDLEFAVIKAGKIVYTAKTRTTGGCDNGASRSSDGLLDIRLSIPGSARIGTNPEQLFAASWSACFESAIVLAACQRRIALPAAVAIDAEMSLNLTDDGYFLSTCRNVSLPGVKREVAQALIDEAHQLCPYSKATRGNGEVTINQLDVFTRRKRLRHRKRSVRHARMGNRRLDRGQYRKRSRPTTTTNRARHDE